MKAGREPMMDPGMMVAPMPPMDAMGAGGPMPTAAAAGGMPPEMAGMEMPAAPMSAVEAVVMALKGMQVQRKGENDALMLAVLQATGAMPNGLMGVTEGAPMSVPDEPMDDAGMMGAPKPAMGAKPAAKAGMPMRDELGY